MKPSYKTLEFWLSFAAMVLGVVMSSGVFEAESKWAQIVGMAISVLAAMGYTGFRTIQKGNELKAEALKLNPPQP